MGRSAFAGITGVLRTKPLWPKGCCALDEYNPWSCVQLLPCKCEQNCLGGSSRKEIACSRDWRAQTASISKGLILSCSQFVLFNPRRFLYFHGCTYHLVLSMFFTRFMAVTCCKCICSSGVLQLLCENGITHCQQNLIMMISVLRVPPWETVRGRIWK